jgi:glycerol uptake facilitator protein
MFGVLAIQANTAPSQSGLAPLLIGLLVWSIGLSLGAPTGYAINPARDLGPRLAHALLPIPQKRNSDWGYAWVPIVGPVVGGLVGAAAYVGLFGA